MSTLGRPRGATAGQFTGVFNTPSPPRRDDGGEPGDPGPEIPAEAPDGPPLASPPPLPVPAAGSARPARSRAAAAPRRGAPAGVPEHHIARSGLGVEALRYRAQLRRLEERARALAEFVDQATAAGMTRAEIIDCVADRTKLTVGELLLLPDLADRLGPGPAR